MLRRAILEETRIQRAKEKPQLDASFLGHPNLPFPNLPFS